MTPAAALLLVARVVSALTTVGVLALVARIRPTADLGIVALGLTAGLALAVIPEAGLTALLTREVAREPEHTGPMLAAILIARAIALPVVVLLAWLLLSAAYSAEAGVIVLVAIGPAVQQVGELARSVFIARGRIAIASAHSIVENVAWVVTIGAGLAIRADLATIFVAAAIVLLVVDAAGYVLLRVILGVRLEWPSRVILARLIRQSGPFIAFGTLVVVASRADTFLIGLLLPNGLPIAGAYFAAARLVAAGEYLPESVSRAIYPDLARGFRSAPGTIASLLAPTARQVLALGIFIPFGLLLAGPWLFDLVYGSDLNAYGWLLLALAGVLPFRFSSILFGVALTSADAQLWRMLALAIAVGLSVAIEIVLIPPLGVVGAIIGIYAVWILTAILSIAATTRLVGRVLQLSDILQPLGLGAVAFGIGTLVAATGVPLATPLSGLTYTGIVFATLAAPTVRAARRGRRQVL